MDFTVYIDALMKFGKILELGLPQFGLMIVMCFVAKLVRDLVTPFDDNAELFKADNPAMGIATAGYYFGMVTALTGVLSGASHGLMNDLRDVAVYGFMAIILLNVARFMVDKLVLRSFSIDKEIVEDQNRGTAWTMFGVYMASGLVIRGAVMGESPDLWSGIWSTLYYFGLSQIALIIAAAVYQKITPYDFHEEIKNDNVAAGLGFGGYLTALGWIIGSTGGNAITLVDTFNFGLWLAVGMVLLTVTRWTVAEHILVPGHKIGDEIKIDRNENAGWMLAVAYMTTALIFSFAV